MSNNSVTLNGFLDVVSIEAAPANSGVDGHYIRAWLYTDADSIPALGGRHSLAMVSLPMQQTDELAHTPIMQIREWQKKHPRKKPYVLVSGKLRSGTDQITISVDRFVLIGYASPSDVVNHVTLQGNFEVTSVDQVPMLNGQLHLRVMLTVNTDKPEMGGRHSVLLSDAAAAKALNYAKAYNSIDRRGVLPEVKVEGHLVSRDQGRGCAIVAVEKAEDVTILSVPSEALADNSPVGELEELPDGALALLGRRIESGNQVDLEATSDHWLPGTVIISKQGLLLLTDNGTEIPLRAGQSLRWPACERPAKDNHSILLPPTEKP